MEGKKSLNYDAEQIIEMAFMAYSPNPIRILPLVHFDAVHLLWSALIFDMQSRLCRHQKWPVI